VTQSTKTQELGEWHEEVCIASERFQKAQQAQVGGCDMF